MYDDDTTDERKGPMDLERLGAIVEAHLDDGVGYQGSQLSRDRAKALDYYYGRKVGVFTAEEGRSSAVTRDVQETVEWAVAQLIRMFAGEESVVFEPENGDDVERARQETDYVNYVFNRDNEGFQILHDWIKDGLLSRLGVAHAQWDDTPESSFELYEGLTETQVELIAMEGEIVEMDTRQEFIQREMPDPQTGQMVTVPEPIQTYDIRVKYRRPRGRVKISVIPPEHFIVTKGATSLVESPFVAHQYPVSRNDLRDMGLDEDTIEEIIRYDTEREFTDEATARDAPSGDYTNAMGTDNVEDELATGWAYDCYLRVDADGDGEDELRRVTYAGGKVIETDYAEDIPYADWCPVPMPHRVHGQGYSDLVMDLQEVRTALLRGGLDNLYLTNLPMKEVAEGKVNMKDLLSPRAGGVVRSKVIGSVREIQTTPMLGPAMQMMEFLDGMRESRTGLTRYNQGLDAESLNKTAAGMNMILNQSQLRLELVARLFAERGLKRLMRLIHGIVRRHQDIPRMVRLGGQWVEVNPSEWRERTNLTVTVGLGNGNREQQIAGMQQMMAMQSQDMAMQMPIVNMQHIYNTRRRMARLLGFKDVENYYSPPPTPEQQKAMQMQQQQAQQMAMQQQAQMQAHMMQLQEQAKAQARIAEAQAKHAMEQQRLFQEHRMKLAEIEARERQDGARLEQDRIEAQQDYDIKVAQLEQAHNHFVAELAQQATLARERMAADAIKFSKDRDIEQDAMDLMEGAGDE